MKRIRWSPGASGLVWTAALALALPGRAEARPGLQAGGRELPEPAGTAAAQLAHAASLRTAMRGLSGEARAAARRAAIEAYRSLRERFPGDRKACAEASFRAGELLRAAGDIQGAVGEFERARELGGETPFRVRAILEIGHVHRRDGHGSAALEAYELALADPGATPSQRDAAGYWSGHVHLLEGRVEAARRSWKRVAEGGEDPLDRLRSWDALAGTFVAAGDLEGAAGVVEQCREALAEVAAEETSLGRRVREALTTMRVLDDLQRAVRERAERRSGRDGDRTDPSGDGGVEKKKAGASIEPRP